MSLKSEETEVSKTRYQQGSVRRVKRKIGPDVWVFRWRSARADGLKKENNRVIGTVLEFRNKAAAVRAAESLRININSNTPRASVMGLTFGELVTHYIARELDVDQEEARSPKAHSTVAANRRYLKKWIVPRWEKVPVNEMEPVAIEDWLAELGRGVNKKSNGTRSKIRGIMSVVFRHGIRHGFLPRDEHANPMKYVRQSSHSDKEQTQLTQVEAMALMSQLQDPAKTMAWLDATTGLRINEVLGLLWSDIDFESGIMRVRRGVVYAKPGRPKTDASRASMPLVPAVLESLEEWRRVTPYAAPEDWVFASPRMKGRQPYWGNTMVANHLRVAAHKVGIVGAVGWHTFRRSFSSWLIDNGENVKVTQELMRHANSLTTMNEYAKAVTPTKRRAQQRIVEGLLDANIPKPKPERPALEEQFAFVG